jgi:hypothetical protein
MNSQSAAIVPMLVSPTPPDFNCPLIAFKDPVMAEYITIMIINNKSPGENGSVFGDSFAHAHRQPKSPLNWKIVSAAQISS